MDIVLAMLLSIVVKGIAAVVEIGIQMLITNVAGVREYGDFIFYVSIVEGGYYFLYSGSIKLNTYYLSIPGYSLYKFKRQYLFRFIIPTLVVFAGGLTIMRSYYGILVGLFILLYYLSFDQSSEFFARRHQMPALFGEYLLGRIISFLGILFVIQIGCVNDVSLFSLYGLQYLAMLIWFLFWRRHYNERTNNEVQVSLHKLFEFQLSDVALSIVSYSPAILQYMMVGAFSAGFTGIISIVRKFINFIAGPTAKVFLPEFSKLYKNKELDKLQNTYVMVVMIQMIFVGTIGAALIAFPQIFLNIFSPELLPYSNIFSLTASCLMVVAGIGPVIGLLQMSGNEHICNRNQWLSIAAMAITWIIFKDEFFFAIFGLCVQSLVQGILNYYSMCRWFGHNVIPVTNYILIWMPVVILKVLVSYMNLERSYIALALAIVGVMVWNLYYALKNPMIRNTVSQKFGNKKRKV